MKRKIAAGNWKMNGLATDLVQIDALLFNIGKPACDVLICPPATLIDRMRDKAAGSVLAVGAQDCHVAAKGAHTGDLSVAMLADAGATYMITGHSERRADHGETDALVCAKTAAVMAGGLVAIVCVGETEAERDAGQTLKVIGAQLQGSLPDSSTAAQVIVAYEPVWAIGTGRTPTLEQIAEVHAFVFQTLAARFGAEGAGMRLLYGGSVKPDNAADIFALDHVDGALVGGASLQAADFSRIVAALDAAAQA